MYIWVESERVEYLLQIRTGKKKSPMSNIYRRSPPWGPSKLCDPLNVIVLNTATLNLQIAAEEFNLSSQP